MAEQRPLDERSKASREKAFVRFINLTERTVEVIWINFTGAYVSYQLLESGGFVDVNTYKGHTWIAIDHKTRDRLQIEKQFVYYPKTTKDYLKNLYNKDGVRWDIIRPDFEARIKCVITIPVHSLRYTCLLAIRNFLGSPEDADRLELPKQLTDDLKKVVLQRNNQIIHTFIRIGD
ncbi:von Hippel-Lindau disease tumor suppressor-like [Tribolium madens]|uniref:von Hippel-Lindau disease tumor suppressor-like n=1 Tax=Tribolium madens TaxID=41895 RepID=UPI001CF73387|nr:von Hippel-Lindau disease tumor suppressor-like [Tribolium madens]